LKRRKAKPVEKNITLIFALILIPVILLVAACGQKKAEPKSLQKEDLKFAYNNKTFELDSDVQTLLDELGSDYEFSEAPSCVYEGTDKAYEYSGIAIYTYPLNGKNLIDEIVLTDSQFKTDKGVKVGSTKEDIINAYGENYIEEGDMLTYRLNNAQADSPCIYFILNNGSVESISYYSASNM